MNLVSKSLTLVLAGAALLFAGCTKKPTRPAPSDTAVVGNTGGATNAGNLGTDLPTGLDARGGDWNGNQNRALLAAQTVYFDYDQSAIKPSEREKLKIAKEHLDKNPTHRLLLEGRCDWRGTAEYNLSLGDRRAVAVKRYLVSIGVAATRVESISKGSLEASKNADDATMAKDRRVDLVVVNQSGATPAPL